MRRASSRLGVGSQTFVVEGGFELEVGFGFGVGVGFEFEFDLGAG
jgi:hypothetical protein